MSLTIWRLIELIQTLGAKQKAMLKILQKSNPMRLGELQTRAMFDVSWEARDRENIVEGLIDKGLVEVYTGKFGVELVRLTPDAQELLDEIDWFVFEDPDLAEALKWM